MKDIAQLVVMRTLLDAVRIRANANGRTMESLGENYPPELLQDFETGIPVYQDVPHCPYSVSGMHFRAMRVPEKRTA